MRREADEYAQGGVRISELYGLLGNSRIAESDLGPRQGAMALPRTRRAALKAP